MSDRADIHVVLLNQLATINALYRALDAERTRTIDLCNQAGVPLKDIQTVIRKR